MAGGGRTGPGSRRRGSAASAVVSLPASSAGDRLDLARLVPSGRSLALAFVLLAATLGAFWAAKSSTVFGVERIEVRGAPDAVARDVRRVTRGLLGTSLVTVDAEAVEGRVRALPTVAAASVDRSFPHTLVVKVAPVWPVAVARRGDDAWLVSGSNRVIRRVGSRSEPSLPRLWIPRKVRVDIGRALPTSYEPATRTLAALRLARIPGGAKAVRTMQGELTVVLRSGVEVTLGDPTDLAVKLAVAARVVPLLDDSMAYLDVTVPERPVASIEPFPQPLPSLNSQVESES